MTPVMLALGANIGDRVANLSQAIQALEERVTPAEQSSVYETAPMYVTDQNRFLNMVVTGTTALSPDGLLTFVKQLENRLGRSKTQRFGPRQIDIDIIFYGQDIVDQGEHLTIPHPRMEDRPFVLIPAREIAPDWMHPRFNQSVSALTDALPKPEDERDIVRRGPLGPNLNTHLSA